MRPFIFPWSKSDERERWLTFFVPQTTLGNLPEVIVESCEQDTLHKGVIILGFEYNREAIMGLRDNGRLHDRLPVELRNDRTLVRFLFIQSDGRIIEDSGEQLSEAEQADLFQCGAEEIFFEQMNIPHRGPILEAPKGFHFVKPSKEHASHFIRIAEVLTDGCRIEFIAASLLRLVKPGIRTVACDTGSIAAVGYALVTLLQRLKPESERLAVFSFGSWDGIVPSNNTSPLAPDRMTLYIISTSTGGGLVKKMCEKHFPDDSIVTLFQYGDFSERNVICRIVASEKQGRRVPVIHVHSADKCPWCNLHSSPLHLRGDQFLPLETKTDTFKVYLDSAPPWLRSFMERSVGTNAITAHYEIGKRGRTHEVFVHFDRLCKGEIYRRRMSQAIKQSVPFDFERIYVCNDPGARQLVKEIVEARSARGMPAPEIVCASELETFPKERYKVGESCLVVAGTVASGRSLMKVSRALRNIQKGGPITYFIGLRRTCADHEQEYLKNTLVRANGGRVPFAFQSIEDIFVPDNTPQRNSHWTEELTLLERLSFGKDASVFPLEEVQKRIEVIKDAADYSQGGLTGELFWPSQNGPLELRANFSFLPENRFGKLSQSEVFFYISCLLHHNRLQSVSAPHGLENSAHRRTLLHPENFRRFNDGILRAALLRASLPAELDFELKEEIDREATALICEAVAAKNEAEGEAATEFLLALALRRVRLSPVGLREVVDIGEKTYAKPLTVEFHLISEIKLHLE